jgi:murein DD-endopeptidase MepM/ murein hydrolase activator NlpD
MRSRGMRGACARDPRRRRGGSDHPKGGRLTAGSLSAALLLAGVATAGPVLESVWAAGPKFGQRALRPGTRGGDVKALQRNLTRLKQPTPADGRYGKGTRSNVRALERRRHWKVDGIVQRRQAKRIKGQVAKQRARKAERKRAALIAASGGYVFPVGDPHNFGGAQARFGAKRSGHGHQGQDVFAPCDTRLYAAQAGTVTVSAYQAGGAGYYMVIHGVDGTHTVYMHMKKRSWASPGTPTYAGQQMGRVGASGNASGCHLHFEHWTAPGWYVGGYPYDPLPELLAWDQYS